MNKKIIFLGFVGIFNIILWPIIMLSDKDQILINFLYLTLLNFTLCAFYFFFRFYFELLIFFNRDDFVQVENIKNNFFFSFFNKYYSKFVFSICMTVCQVYWLLILGGEKLMTFPQENLFVKFLGVYLHLIIGIFMYIDMNFIEITLDKINYHRDYMIFNLIQICYSILLTILAKNYKSCVIYPFLELELSQILSINIIICLAYRNSYQFYYHIHKSKRNKLKYKKADHLLESHETNISMEKPFFNDEKI